MANNDKVSKRRPPSPPVPPFPPPPPHPHPPKPPKPPKPPRIESKDIILTKKLNHVLYELIVKTRGYMVYVDEDGKSDKITLTEKLSDIADALLEINEKCDTFDNKFADLMRDAPETFDSFKEVWDYVNINGDPKSELIAMIESKQDKEEGKGLSTHDLTDVLYEKLTNDYTREELDEKFEIIDQRFNDEHELIVNDINELKEEFNRELEDLVQATEAKFSALTDRVIFLENDPNVKVSEEQPDGLVDYDTWYKVVSKDNV